MPTFDFECDNCGNVFEFSRPFGSTVRPPCPACKSKKTEKLMSPPAIHFKGEGWYKTDSKKTTTAPKKEEKVESAKSDATTPEAKTEKKAPEPAPDAAKPTKDKK